MNPCLIRLNSITTTDFKSYLLSKQDSSKWFYWHLSSDLINYDTFAVFDQTYHIGVVCIEKNESPLVDLYIAAECRRMGYGKSVMCYVVQNFQNVKIEVNANNKAAMDFFDHLFAERVIKSMRIVY
jgi:ribosomal protein S18 acetylase RimI-like enzyme